MYRGDDEAWRDEIEARVGAAEKKADLHASRRLWLGAGIIALTLCVALGAWTDSVRMTRIEAAVGLCQEGEVAEASAERHRVTRQQDDDLCDATCASVRGLDDIDSAGPISATCSWQDAGVRSCVCSCSVLREGLGRLSIYHLDATESR